MAAALMSMSMHSSASASAGWPFSAALSLVNAQLSGSKVVWACAAILASLGSRFVITDITPAQQGVLTSPVVRRMVVFCMIFLPTRDVLLSACMTVVFFALVDGLLNERSRYCVLPECVRARPKAHRALPVAHRVLSRMSQVSPSSHGMRVEVEVEVERDDECASLGDEIDAWLA